MTSLRLQPGNGLLWAALFCALFLLIGQVPKKAVDRPESPVNPATVPEGTTVESEVVPSPAVGTLASGVSTSWTNNPHAAQYLPLLVADVDDQSNHFEKLIQEAEADEQKFSTNGSAQFFIDEARQRQLIYTHMKARVVSQVAAGYHRILMDRGYTNAGEVALAAGISEEELNAALLADKRP